MFDTPFSFSMQMDDLGAFVSIVLISPVAVLVMV